MLSCFPHYYNPERFKLTTTPIFVDDKILGLLSKPTAIDVNDIAHLLKSYSFMVNILHLLRSIVTI